MIALANCDGDGGMGGTGGAPSPSPTPAPTVTPSPTPSPGPTLGHPLPGTTAGQVLGGPLVCVNASIVEDANGHVIEVGSIAGVKSDNVIGVTVRATDSYLTNVNGFGGSSYLPSDERTSPNLAYDQFLNSAGDEFFIMRPSSLAGTRTFATLGIESSGPDLCFFAVGPEATSLPDGSDIDYTIVLDGIARIGGQTYRLLPSAGTLNVDFAAGAATLHMELKGRGNAFDDFSSQPIFDIATADATIGSLTGFVVGPTPLSGPNGFTGTVTGQFVGDASNVSGEGGSGAALVFELRSSNGDVIFGAIVGERSMI